MSNGISIYSETDGFDSRLFFPILLGRTIDGISLGDFDQVSGTYGSGYISFTYKGNTFDLNFEGTYIQHGGVSDANGYISSAFLQEMIGGQLVTIAELTIFPDAGNSHNAVPVQSLGWMTPDSLLIQAAQLGGSHFSLLGGSGSDKLYGSQFADYFNGEGGRDVLTGYAGKDQFLFDSIGKANADHITDFTHKQDKILIDVSDDPSLFGDVTENSDFRKIFHDITNASEDGDDRFLYNHKTGQLSYDSDGKGGNQAVVFAYLDNHAKIDFHDFQIF